jgi:hypothetical protein
LPQFLPGTLFFGDGFDGCLLSGNSQEIICRVRRGSLTRRNRRPRVRRGSLTPPKPSTPRSARVSDPAETVDRRSPGHASAENKPEPSLGFPSTGFPQLNFGDLCSTVKRHRSKPKPDSPKSHAANPRSSSRLVMKSDRKCHDAARLPDQSEQQRRAAMQSSRRGHRRRRDQHRGLEFLDLCVYCMQQLSAETRKVEHWHSTIFRSIPHTPPTMLAWEFVMRATGPFDRKTYSLVARSRTC